MQPMFIYEPSLTSVQLRQANLAELKKNDHYWENRLKNQQANHQKINEIMDTEYKRAVTDLAVFVAFLTDYFQVDEMEVTEKTKAQSKALPPCQDAKKAVMQCYIENSNEPMKCANVVQAFQQCVDSKRASLIANRG
jgi:hypothetical protein